VDCSNCGGELPEAARFCPRCGVATGEPRTGAASQARSTAPEAQGERFEMCVIERWQGYVKSDFYARGSNAAGAQEIARSPLFFSRQRELPPDNEKALAAHRILVEGLLGAGWQPVGRPQPWYAQKFRRPAGTAEGAVVNLPAAPDMELEEPLPDARGLD
jgi:hypothetical protein